MWLTSIEGVAFALLIDEQLSIGTIGSQEHRTVVAEGNAIGAFGNRIDRFDGQRRSGDGAVRIERCARRVMMVMIGERSTGGKFGRGDRLRMNGKLTRGELRRVGHLLTRAVAAG